MADPNEADNPDPFAQLASSKSYKPANDDPFAELASSKDYASGGEDKTSTLGAFATGAATGVIPAAAGLMAAGPGAEAGAALGLLGGPYAPFTVPAGGLIGGAASMIGASYGAAKAQDYALSKLPDTWRDALDQQREAAEKEHPIASFLGGLVPYAVTMTPMGAPATLAKLPENATTFMRLMAHPLTKRIFPATLMGGLELGQEKLHDDTVSWPKVAIATGFGLVFNHPLEYGQKITNLGVPVTRSMIETVSPGATARVARILNPTIAQARDLGVMDVSATEATFRGGETRNPQAEMTANEAARTEQGLIGPPAPPPDIRGIARRLDPDTFARYDELRDQRDTFRHWIDIGAPGDVDRATVDRHLAATEAEMAKLEPDVAAAYRRAAEATGSTTVEPEGHPEQFKSFAAMLAARDKEATSAALPAPAEAVPEKPAADLRSAPSAEVGVAASEGVAGPQPVPTRFIEQQRDFIAQDVARQFVAAGYPQEQAEATGRVVAANYESMAALFKGKLGSAEDLYRREGAIIKGPRGTAAQRRPAQPRPQAPPATEAPTTTTKQGSPVRRDRLEGISGIAQLNRELDARALPRASPRDLTSEESGALVEYARAAASGDEHDTAAAALLLRPYGIRELRPGVLVDADGKTIAFVDNGRLWTTDGHRLSNGQDVRAFREITPPEPEPAHIESKPPRQINENALSLLAFLAHRGGIRADEPNIADLRSSVGNNRFEPGFGALIRQPRELSTAAERGGASAPMYLDRARIAAAEAGYLPMDSTVADFLGLIDKEAHGQKVYQPGYEREAAASERPEDEFGAAAPLSPEQIAAEEAETERLHELTGGMELSQSARGGVTLNPEGVPGRDFLGISGVHPILRIAQSRNASTGIHEYGHIFLAQLMRYAEHPDAPLELKNDARTTLDWIGAKTPDEIARSHQEKFARGFEQYLREGTAPSKELASVFAKFRAWLLKVYDTLERLIHEARSTGAKDFVGISDSMRGVFDRMLASEPQRTVIAPERQPEMSLANIHENDAAGTEPHEAIAQAALIKAEATRYVTEPPADIAHDIAIAQANIEAEQALAAARSGAEPTGGPGGGTGPAAEVEPGGGEPQPVTEGGGVGQERGPVVSGGGGPLPEGDRLAGERGEAKPDAGSPSAEGAGNQQQPHAFAPGPAASLERPESRLVGKDGNIRAENITSKDELIEAVNESSDRLIANGRTTGPLTMGEMIAAANDILIDPATISEGELAATFGGLHQLSSKIWALRVAIKKSAGMVSAAMEQAARSKNPADLLQMWETIQRHDMMQSTLSGVTTETSRGTGMGFRNMEGWEQVEKLDMALQNAKVQELTGRTLYQLEEIAKMGAQMDTPAKLSKYLRDEQKPTFGRMILEYWTNTLLSGLGHITYWEANGIMTAERALVLHPVAALVGRVLGHTGDTVRAGEFWQAFKGAKAGAAAAVRATGQAAASGMNVLLPGETMVVAMQQEATRIATSESLKGDDRVKRVRDLMQSPTASMLQVAHEQMAPAQAAMPFEQNAPLTSAPTADITTTWRDVKADFAGFLSGLRNGVQTWGALVAAGGRPGEPLLNWTRPANGYIGNLHFKGIPALPVGSMVRAPSRMVATIHTSTRVLNYSIDIRQQAYRMAYNEATEAGLQGAELTQRVAERASELAQNPTPYMMQQAHQVSSEVALMEQGGALLRKLSGLINWEPDLPILGLTKPLKFIDPFVNVAGNIFKQSIWTHTPLGAVFSKEIQRDLMGKNGNVAQEMAMAKIIVGTTIGVTFGMLAASGQMNGSGPTDRAENLRWRAMGNLPHGIRIGDTWYDAHRLGTLGMLASSAADMYEVAHLMSEQDAQHAAAMFMHAVSQNFLDEGFMRGPADLLRAIEDSGRYGDGYVRDFFSSFMPYSVLSAQLARNVDPYSRQVRSFMDAVRAKIPYMSEDLLPRRDIWGQPQPNLSTFGLGAIYERQVSHDPVNQAIYQLKVPVSLPQRRIGHAALTDEQYDEYAGLAGHTAKQYLDALVRAPGFAGMPDTIRRDAMTQTIRSAHAVAEQMMMQRHHDLAIAAHQKPEIKP